MKRQKAQRETALDAPKDHKKFTLYPASFWLLDWLRDVRKNPAITGASEPSMKEIGELCYVFTMPSIELERMPKAKLAENVNAFMHGLSAADFKLAQVHAQRELSKYFATAVVPKKAPGAAPKPRPKR